MATGNRGRMHPPIRERTPKNIQEAKQRISLARASAPRNRRGQCSTNARAAIGSTVSPATAGACRSAKAFHHDWSRSTAFAPGAIVANAVQLFRRGSCYGTASQPLPLSQTRFDLVQTQSAVIGCTSQFVARFSFLAGCSPGNLLACGIWLVSSINCPTNLT